MIQRKILSRAVLVGVILEVGLVVLTHLRPGARGMLLFGAMMIAGMAGLLYARDLARGYGLGALGGGAAGAASGVAAVGLATFLHDRPELKRGMDDVRHRLIALVEPDADRLNLDPERFVHVWRMLTFAGSHKEIADNDLLTPEQIVDIVLNGAERK